MSRDLLTTEGLVPYIRRVGRTVNYTPALYAVQKFDEMAKVLDSENAGKYICMLNGLDLDIDIENALVDYLGNTDVQFARERVVKQHFNKDADLEVTAGFNYMTKGQRIFALKSMPIFTAQKTYGATGFTTPGLGIVVPMAQRRDKLTDSMVPSFGTRYKEHGNYNRSMEVWNVSGAGPFRKVTSVDLHNYYLRAHVGFHGIAGNQMLLLDPVVL